MVTLLSKEGCLNNPINNMPYPQKSLLPFSCLSGQQVSHDRKHGGIMAAREADDMHELPLFMPPT